MATDLTDLQRTARLPGLASLVDGSPTAADPERAAAPRPPTSSPRARADAARRSGRPTPRRRSRASSSTLCGAAPFLAPLPRPPSRLARPPGRRRPRRAARRRRVRARLDAALRDVAPDDDAAAALRRFKYYELARITVRDLWAAPGDARRHRGGARRAVAPRRRAARRAPSSARSRDVAAARRAAALDRRPTGPSSRRASAVLGLGKLGGEELNYSSDVDLIYVLETPGGGRRRAEARAAVAARILHPRRARVRPPGDGERRATASSIASISICGPRDSRARSSCRATCSPSYYDALGGDVGEGRVHEGAAGRRRSRVRLARHPRHRSDDLPLGDGLRRRRGHPRDEGAESSRQAGRAGGAFNVKIGAGGIRDVEFVAQALQLLHGGRIPQVRDRSTAAGADGAGAGRRAPRPRRRRPARRAYAFLRRTENRLQMEGERQTHRLPRDAPRATRAGARHRVRRRRSPPRRSRQSSSAHRADASAPSSRRCSPRTASSRCSTCSSAPSRSCWRSRRRAADRGARGALRARDRGLAEPRAGDEQPRPLHPRRRRARASTTACCSTAPSWSIASPTSSPPRSTSPAIWRRIRA